jgi:hypothetical protein
MMNGRGFMMKMKLLVALMLCLFLFLIESPFFKPDVLAAPSIVVTVLQSDVNSVKFSGQVSGTAADHVTEFGIQVRLSNVINAVWKDYNGGFLSNPFTIIVPDLVSNKTYDYRGYVKYSGGTVYSNTLHATTNKAPDVTASVSDIKTTSMMLHYQVITNGNTLEYVGFTLYTKADMAEAMNLLILLDVKADVADYAVQIAPLRINTEYVLKPYAKTALGATKTVYSTVVFKTASLIIVTPVIPRPTATPTPTQSTAPPPTTAASQATTEATGTAATTTATAANTENATNTATTTMGPTASTLTTDTAGTTTAPDPRASAATSELATSANPGLTTTLPSQEAISPDGQSPGGGMNTLLVILLAGAVVALAGVVVFLLIKRRKV